MTKLKKVFALFSSDVSFKDRYNVTTPPSSFFKTREEARKYMKIRKWKAKDTKIFSYHVPKGYNLR